MLHQSVITVHIQIMMSLKQPCPAQKKQKSQPKQKPIFVVSLQSAECPTVLWLLPILCVFNGCQTVNSIQMHIQTSCKAGFQLCQALQGWKPWTVLFPWQGTWFHQWQDLVHNVVIFKLLAELSNQWSKLVDSIKARCMDIKLSNSIVNKMKVIIDQPVPVETHIFLPWKGVSIACMTPNRISEPHPSNVSTPETPPNSSCVVLTHFVILLTPSVVAFIALAYLLVSGTNKSISRSSINSCCCFLNQEHLCPLQQRYISHFSLW